MELLALGTGSAFCNYKKNWQSNFILRVNGKNLLLDAGGDLRHALSDAGMWAGDIDAVFISHAHADHTGGMEYLMFLSEFVTTKKITLFVEGRFAKELWENTLEGGGRSVEGRLMELKDYFNVVAVPSNNGFDWEGIHFTMTRVIHVADGFDLAYSYGLQWVDESGSKVFWTSDCQYSPINYMMAIYHANDHILHDCETGPKSGVHAHFDELCLLPDEIKAKMWLYHFQDNVIDNWDEWQGKAHANGFRGFLRRGDRLISGKWGEVAKSGAKK